MHIYTLKKLTKKEDKAENNFNKNAPSEIYKYL